MIKRVCGFLLCVCFLCVSSLFVHFFGLDSINQSIRKEMKKVSLFLSLVVATAVSLAYGQNCLLNDDEKKDCGFAGIDSTACVAKGCCWSPAGQNSATPWCFYGSSDTSTYELESIGETAYGFSGVLVHTNTKGNKFHKYGVNEDITRLKMDVFMQSDSTIRVRIDDASTSANRWQVPTSVIPRADSTLASETQDYAISFSTMPFAFEITRKSDGASLFKSSENLVFMDQYIVLSTTIDQSAKTFGLGVSYLRQQYLRIIVKICHYSQESARTSHALKSGQTYTLWAADVASYGKDINLYSSHPFYLQMVNNAAHGVLLLNRCAT
jgi:hypothetical protein